MRYPRLFQTCCQIMAWLFVGMLLSGVFLFLYYQPDPAASWGDESVPRPGFGRADLVQTTHRLVALCFLATSILAAVVGLVKDDKSPVRVGVLRRATMMLIPVLTVLCVYTGFLLRWDQLALYAVTVGDAMSGYKFLFGDEVKFVLSGSSVRSVEFVRNSFIVHLVAASAIALGLVLWPSRKPVDVEAETVND